jgi:hypothetical protein
VHPLIQALRRSERHHALVVAALGERLADETRRADTAEVRAAHVAEVPRSIDAALRLTLELAAGLAAPGPSTLIPVDAPGPPQRMRSLPRRDPALLRDTQVRLAEIDAELDRLDASMASSTMASGVASPRGPAPRESTTAPRESPSTPVALRGAASSGAQISRLRGILSVHEENVAALEAQLAGERRRHESLVRGPPSPGRANDGTRRIYIHMYIFFENNIFIERQQNFISHTLTYPYTIHSCLRLCA